jgi:hypothetical protein
MDSRFHNGRTRFAEPGIQSTERCRMPTVISKSLLMLDYWDHHSNRDRRLLDKLGLNAR